MGNKQIILTEQDLHFLVENAVKTYLTENEMEEGVWGGLKNAWNGIKQGNLNVGQSYRSGNLYTNFKKYANQAMQAIGGMKQIADNTRNTQISNYLAQVSGTVQNTVDHFEKVAQNVASGNTTYNQNNNPFKLNRNRLTNFGYYSMYNKPQTNTMKKEKTTASNGTTNSGFANNQQQAQGGQQTKLNAMGKPIQPTNPNNGLMGGRSDESRRVRKTIR